MTVVNFYPTPRAAERQLELLRQEARRRYRARRRLELLLRYLAAGAVIATLLIWASAR